MASISSPKSIVKAAATIAQILAGVIVARGQKVESISVPYRSASGFTRNGGLRGEFSFYRHRRQRNTRKRFMGKQLRYSHV